MTKFFIRHAFAVLALVAVSTPSTALANGSLNFAPSTAGRGYVVRTETWVEEWEPTAKHWVRPEDYLAERHAVTSISPSGGPVGVFGPFVVINATTAALMGTTNGDSPADFNRMRATFPDVAMLEFVEAPGTIHDIANLALGRMIRAAGIATHVPNNGSVRSGAVELFLAGTVRSMEPGARFAVHAWRDERGRGPQDFAPEDPVNRLYTAYYEDMGMSAADAQAFYAMTNSVPHSGALWFGPERMTRWIENRNNFVNGREVTVAKLAYDPNLLFHPFPPTDDLQLILATQFARILRAQYEEFPRGSAFSGT